MRVWPLSDRLQFCCDDTNSPPSGGTAPPAPSGGSPAPSPSGAPEGTSSSPPETPDSGAGETSTPSHDPFEGLDDDLDAIDIGLGDSGTGDEPGPQVAPQAAGTPSGEPKPAADGKPPAQPQAAAPPQVQPAAPSEKAAPSPPQSQLDFALQGFKANEKELGEWASQNLFSLTQEEKDALETDAVSMIPKLMGRVYVGALQAASNLIKNFVPEMVNTGVNVNSQRAAKAAEALNEFYQANPHLSADKHGAAVDRWARAFRAANPQASRKDAIAFVGRAVSAEVGLMPGAVNGGTRKAAVPFAPARPGGKAPTTSQPHDPYAGMEDDDFE